MKGFIGYIIAFVFLILASLSLAKADPIGVATAQAQGEMAVGSNAFAFFENSLAWVLKLTIGAVVSSVLGVMFFEAWKRYRRWDRNERARRWNPGPNARWQQNSSANLPRLKREDLMLMALMGRNLPNNGINTRLGTNQTAIQEEPSRIDLEF